MSAVTAKAVSWTETGLVPDTVIRAGIRRLLENKRREIRADDVEIAAATLNDFVAMMNASPIALVPDLANEQHYEVPAEFFTQVMGDHLKYSCCYWPDGVTTITEAEAAALAKTCERAGIEDGMQVLDIAADSERQFVFGAGLVKTLADPRLEFFGRGVPETGAVARLVVVDFQRPAA